MQIYFFFGGRLSIVITGGHIMAHRKGTDNKANVLLGNYIKIEPNGLFAAILFIISSIVYAQPIGSNIYGLQSENDGWFGSMNNSDEFYTNGFQIDYTRILQKKNDLSTFIGDLDHFTTLDHAFIDSCNYSSLFSLKIVQNMYTPSSLSPSEPLLDDRPYAGWTRLDFSIGRNYLFTDDKNQLRQNQTLYGISIGSLGDAGAGATQTIVHTIGDATIPNGWPNHIKDRIAMQLYFGKTRNIFSADNLPCHLWLSVYNRWNIELGNVFTRASSSLTFKLGLFSEPNILGQIDSSIHKINLARKGKELQCLTFNLFATPKVYLSAYNGTLDAKTDVEYNIEQVPVFVELLGGGELTAFREHIYIAIAPINIRSVEFLVDNKIPNDIYDLFYHTWGQLTLKVRF